MYAGPGFLRLEFLAGQLCPGDLPGSGLVWCRSAVFVGSEVDGRMAKLNPFQFAQEVRQETSKVTWPSRRETWITTVAVMIMVTLSALFFLAVDQVLGYVVSSVLQMLR